ncbi:MAG: hydantoinase/oxoprolinase family protein, partial [Planctomycetes bacterium]|nr:hydantoinase/oxoprolinase family protein [Planctomycetota bacterium]
SGGIMSSSEANEFPARALLSGPAGGIAACSSLATMLGVRHAATLDMGGTSTDVGLVGAMSEIVATTRIAGMPLTTPSVDMHTIGCGGGSIAHVDAGGALRVGPGSAGADPGPACYGKGDEPTVTDAHVVLGHIGPSTLLGGAFGIDPDRARRAIERLGRRIGLDAERCARGILEIAEVTMVRALLVMTVERRIDPATVPLIAFGGAGGLHAAALARRLGMPRAIVPEHPGAFSAVGLVLAGESHEAVRTVLRPLHEIAPRELASIVRDASRAARDGLEGRSRKSVETAVLLRYQGQGGGLVLDAGPGLGERFAALHEQRFGFRVENRSIELVRVEARATTPATPLPPTSGGPGRRPRPIQARHGRPVYARQSLPLGVAIEGPALIEEQTSVIVVPGDFTARRSRAGVELVSRSS